MNVCVRVCVCKHALHIGYDSDVDSDGEEASSLVSLTSETCLGRRHSIFFSWAERAACNLGLQPASIGHARSGPRE